MKTRTIESDFSVNLVQSSLRPFRLTFWLMGMVCIGMVCLHMLIRAVSGIVLVNEAVGLESTPDSFVFAVIGLMFFGLTALTHWWLVRGSSHTPVTQGAFGRERGPVGMVFVSMVIRFAGTFAILGSLMVLKVVGRHEAAFNVLFWYVTLTTMEIGGIVWASRPTRFDGTGAIASRPDES